MPRQRLVIDSDDSGRFFLAVKDGALTVGAEAGTAEIVLADLRVLRIHCEVDVDAGSFHAGNELAAGKPLHIGHAHVRLVAPTDASDAAGDGDIPEVEDLVVPEDDASPPPAAASAGPAASSLVKRLIVIDGADHGRWYLLPDSGIVTLGNSQKHADIVLHDLYVARVHCELKIHGERIVVTHRESARGTLINGTRITEQELQLNDILRIGNTHLRLELAVAGAPAKAGSGDNLPARAPAPTAPAAASGSGEHATPPSSPVDPLADLEGQVLGHYQFGALLGRGHSGLVFRAHHRQSNQAVTVKVLSPEFPKTEPELQGFVKAMKVVAPLRHPHLVSVLNVGKTGPLCWIAREFVEGESLATLIPRLHAEGKLGWKRACRAAVQLGKVLDFLDQRGVTHNNLTPSNVLIQSESKATLLADLMLDKALEGSELADLIREKKLLAELPYYAPEQLDPEAPTDHRTTLYALGTVLYALLTGRPPYIGTSPETIIAEILEGRAVKPSKFLRETPPPFDAAVLKLLAKDPNDRYQSAADLLAVVEPIANIHEIKV